MVINHALTLDAPMEAAWDLLLDLNRLSGCIPGCERITPKGKNRFGARVLVKVAFIKAAFDLDVTITELDPPRHLCCIARGEEDGRLSFLTVVNTVDLSPRSGGGTEVAFHSRVNLGGKLGSIPHPAIRGRASELVQEFMRDFESQVASATSGHPTGISQ